MIGTGEGIEIRRLYNLFTEASQEPLPGVAAQLVMAPSGRIMEMEPHAGVTPVRSGVLILLYHKGGVLTTLFIRRPEYSGIHSGQIAFPGGRQEADDANIQYTALRETEEETGIPQERITIAAPLTPLYIPPSNYMVYPFLALTRPDPVFIPDPSEVASIIEIPLVNLLTPDCIKRFPPAPEFKFLEVPAYVFNDIIIWGATAMITAELIELINQNNLRKKLNI